MSGTCLSVPKPLLHSIQLKSLQIDTPPTHVYTVDENDSEQGYNESQIYVSLVLLLDQRMHHRIPRIIIYELNIDGEQAPSGSSQVRAGREENLSRIDSKGSVQFDSADRIFDLAKHQTDRSLRIFAIYLLFLLFRSPFLVLLLLIIPDYHYAVIHCYGRLQPPTRQASSSPPSSENRPAKAASSLVSS